MVGFHPLNASKERLRLRVSEHQYEQQMFLYDYFFWGIRHFAVSHLLMVRWENWKGIKSIWDIGFLPLPSWKWLVLMVDCQFIPTKKKGLWVEVMSICLSSGQLCHDFDDGFSCSIRGRRVTIACHIGYCKVGWTDYEGGCGWGPKLGAASCLL